MNDFDYKQNNNNNTPNGEYHYSYTPYGNQNGENKPPRKKHEKKYGIGALVAVALITAVFCSTLTSGGMYFALRGNNTASSVGTSSNATTSSNSTSSQQAVINQTTNITVNETAGTVAQAVAQKCTESVVGIRVTATVTSTNIFGQSTQSQTQSELMK